MVCRIQLTYDETINMLDTICIPTKRIGFSQKPDIHQLGDINSTFKKNLPYNLEINVSVDERKNKSNLKNNQT